MIRQSFIQRIIDHLCITPFKSIDFSITPDKEEDWKVVYLPDPAFYFDVKYDQTIFGLDVTLTTAPGITKSNETHWYRRAEVNLFQEIKDWQVRINEDLMSNPQYRLFLEMQEKIPKIESILSELPNNFFTRDEAELLKSKLDELRTDFEKNILANEENEDVIENKFSALSAEIDMLKSRVESMSKRSWAKQCLIRITGWLNDPLNRKLLQNGAELVKNLLPEVKELPPF